MQAKKSLGQNFLTSVGAINKIVETALFSGGPTSANDLTILEVGPGKGVLTEALLKKFNNVVAVEKDYELITFLREKFAEEVASGQLRLIEGDILKLKPEGVIASEAKQSPEPNLEIASSQTPRNDNTEDYAIVANIPYYITGQFLRIWLSANPKPQYMVLMIQKEVARRIVAADKKESLLSISVKIYGEPQYIETIKRGSFFPIPNVDSAILAIKLYLDTECPSEKEAEEIFEILKAGFAHKRKLLLNNLKIPFISARLNLTEIFNICKIDPKARAENLTVGDWKCLAKFL